MSEFKGTRGPWQYKEATGDKYIFTPMGALMSSNYPYSQSINASEHDWRLIAAAPDLLEALMPITKLEMWTESAEDDELVIMSVGTVRKMRAAVAKALGDA